MFDIGMHCAMTGCADNCIVANPLGFRRKLLKNRQSKFVVRKCAAGRRRVRGGVYMGDGRRRVRVGLGMGVEGGRWGADGREGCEVVVVRPTPANCGGAFGGVSKHHLYYSCSCVTDARPRIFFHNHVAAAFPVR